MVLQALLGKLLAVIYTYCGFSTVAPREMQCVKSFTSVYLIYYI
jgi:hypothetical protein